MTVASDIVTRTYVGNGLVRDWPIPFELPPAGAQYVQVYITAPGGAPVLLWGGYSVDQAAMSVKYPISGDPLASGYKITIRRQLPLTQEIDLNSQGPFDPETIERTFDRETMQIQQLAEAVDRAAKVPIGSLENSDDLWDSLKTQVATATEAAASAADSACKAESEANNAYASAQAAGNSAQAASDILKAVQDAGTEAIDGISDAVAAGKAQISAEFDGRVDAAAASATDAQESAEAAAASAKTAAQYSKGLEYDWQGTELGVRREGAAGFEYVDLQGPAGSPGEVTLAQLEERLAVLPTCEVDLTEIEAALALKADKTTVNAGLALKADKTALDALAVEVAGIDISSEKAQTLSGKAFVLDPTGGSIITLDLTGNAIIAIPSATGVSRPALTLTLIIIHGGAVLITWQATNLVWHEGIAPTLTTSGSDIVTLFTHNYGATWFGAHWGSFAS